MYTHDDRSWQEKAAAYARIMSRVTWTLVADTMPNRKGGYFEEGTEYVGTPYSSVKSVGRYIGFEIFLKTFLAAVQNPRSVLYTEDLSGTVSNAAAYYGKVCSSYTSYALQCAVWYVSRQYTPPYRDGVVLVDPQSAQVAAVGDIIFTPPSPGSHVEIVTGVTKDDAGTVTHVQVEESRPPTTTDRNRTAEDFDAHILSRDRKLYRITDLDAWRGDNRAGPFLFPNYAEDAATPEINRVLLTERTFSVCGDYTAHCAMADGSTSRPCEFAVCELDVKVPQERIRIGEPWEIAFTSENMDVIIAYLCCDTNSYAHYPVFVTDQDREKGRVSIPGDLVRDTGNWQIWLMGENRYGRLKKRYDITATG